MMPGDETDIQGGTAIETAPDSTVQDATTAPADGASVDTTVGDAGGAGGTDAAATPVGSLAAGLQPSPETDTMLDRLAEMLEKVDQPKAPQADPAEQAGKAATPQAQPAAQPKAGPDIDAVVKQSLAAADEYMGDGAGERVLKPLTDTIAALRSELDALKGDIGPVKQFTTAAQQQAQAEAAQQSETAVRKFFDERVGVYGGKFDDLLKNPEKAAKAQAVVQRAAQVQDYFASQGQQIPDEDALGLAEALINRQQTVSEARKQLLGQLKTRTAQRTAPSRAAATGGGQVREPETYDEILARTKAVWPLGE